MNWFLSPPNMIFFLVVCVTCAYNTFPIKIIPCLPPKTVMVMGSRLVISMIFYRTHCCYLRLLPTQLKRLRLRSTGDLTWNSGNYPSNHDLGLVCLLVAQGKGKMSALGAARRMGVNRRKGNFKELNSIRDIDFGLSSKDIAQLVREQLITDEQSIWKGSDLLYLTAIVKNSKSKAINTFQENAVVVAKMGDRYMALLRKAGDNQGAFLLKMIRKENDVVVKASFTISELRSIDYGSDELELVLSFESQDTSIHFGNQADRDEALYILAQVAKYTTGADPYIGYSVDLDAITYLMATSAAPSKFPALQKILKATAINIGDQFSIEESEAEHILDELNWGNSMGGIGDVHQLLTQKSVNLNHEIIDFLLQWEEMDEFGASAVSKQQGSTGKNRASLSTVDFGLKDTGEVLKALSMVDTELAAVDKWLGEQIEHMAEIQSNLYIIEDESGTIESSWQSLTVVEKVLQILLEKYTMDAGTEALLLSPDKALAPILKSTSLTTSSQQMLTFVTAVKSLRDALAFRMHDLQGLTSQEWKQIQNIPSIRAQRDKLVSISESFCSKLSQIAIGIFDWLLKHRTLVDGDIPGAMTILPKVFNTLSLLEKFSYYQGLSSVTIDQQSLQQFLSPPTNLLLDSQAIFHKYLDFFIPMIDLLLELKPNYARPICEAYVRAAHDKMYFPLIKSCLKEIQGYITVRNNAIGFVNCERFRCDVHSEPVLRFDQTKAILSTSNKAAASMSTGTNKVISAWKALQVALMLICPLLEREEAYMKKTFKVDGRMVAFMDAGESGVGGNGGDDLSNRRFGKVHDMIDGVFEGLVPRFLKLTATSKSTEKDGVEAVAMLSVLREFSAMYLEWQEDGNGRDNLGTSLSTGSSSNAAAVSASIDLLFSPLSASSSVGVNGKDDAGGTIPPRATYFISKMLHEMTTSLENVINQYRVEQIVWINSQKADAKSPGVLAPFYKFPSLLHQILEMTNGMSFPCVEDLLAKLARELFLWLNTFARQNDKYTEKIKITNLSFFRLSVGSFDVSVLQSFVTSATQQVEEAIVKYINWMVEYEFPSLSALALRMDGVGSRVNDEELSVYIRRKDVLNVIKELEHKTIDVVVANLRKRLEKHYKSEFDGECRLVASLWAKLKDRMIGILTKLDTAASLSYQIQLEISPSKVADLFDRMNN